MISFNLAAWTRRVMQMATATACLLCSVQPSDAAWGYTDLSYNSSTFNMSGESHTLASYYEEVGGEFYYQPCECTVTYVGIFEIDAGLRNPANQLVATTPPTYSQWPSPGISVYMPSYRPTMVGTWRAFGLHYVITTYYIGPYGVFSERVATDGTSDEAFVPCIVPAGESTHSLGWDSFWPTTHNFKGRLQPSVAAFYGGAVTEYQPGPSVDGCYDPTIMPQELEYTGLSGGTWSVDGNNEWQADQIGWNPDGVALIRQLRAAFGRPMPCEIVVPQQMRYLSCGSAPVYKSHSIGIRIGTKTLTVFRDQVAVGRTWPITTAALRALSTGMYVAAENGGGSYLIANRTTANAWESFDMTEVVVMSNVINIIASNGQYVAAEQGGGQAVNANRVSAGPWEEFIVEDVGDGYIALRTLDGHYLRAVPPSGLVDAVPTTVGPWEKFERIPQ